MSISDTNDRVKKVRKKLVEAKKKLESFEATISLNDPTYTEIMNAKNAEQRKLVLERNYRASPNEGVYDSMRHEIMELEMELENAIDDRNIAMLRFGKGTYFDQL